MTVLLFLLPLELLLELLPPDDFGLEVGTLSFAPAEILLAFLMLGFAFIIALTVVLFFLAIALRVSPLLMVVLLVVGFSVGVAWPGTRSDAGGRRRRR